MVSPAVAFVGRQNSGKTTLVEKLITELVARGFDVGSVKHHGHRGFQIDVEGKDSWRHAQAGASEVAIASPDRFALIRSHEAEMEFTGILELMAAHDIVIVEGYRLSGLPTIELFRAGNPNDDGMTIADAPQEIIAVVTDKDAIADEALAVGLPQFGFEDIAPIADFLERAIMGISKV